MAFDRRAYQQAYDAQPEARRKHAARERARRQTPEVKAYNREVSRKYRLANKDKIKARKVVGHAISSGKIKRGPCEVCGVFNSEAHHDDYTKPFDIRWLCGIHHKQLHRKVA